MVAGGENRRRLWGVASNKELRPLMADDTTTLSYWLTWRFFLCALWIIIAMIGATILIIKYEVFTQKKTDRKDNEHDIEPIGILYEDETWKTSLKSLHPAWLLGYRLLAFGIMLSILIANLIVAGPDVFFFYTQWTFALVTFYFGIGFLLSIYGCYKNWNEVSDDHNNHIVDPERGNYMAPSEALSSNINPRKTAVGLTDSVFWFIIYPFLTPEEYSLNFLDVSMHSLNAILLIIDMSLNRLRFPFFRLAYFGLWTCIFVIFQWIVHACVSMYLGVGLIHLPAYGIFALLVRGKQLLLSRFLDTNGA
ncbi:hypothetical protein LXL04_025835 [Taraxacum kok-saghyz]